MAFRPLKEVPHSYISIEQFGGLNRTPAAAPGEFTDMANFSSDGLPFLQTRQGRSVAARPENATGILCKDALCHCDGSRFYMNGYGVELGLSGSPKELVSMGAYVIILPDKKYINTADLTDFGDLEASFSAEGTLAVSICDAAGEDITLGSTGSLQPEAQEGYWMNTDTGELMQWSASLTAWVAVESTYVKLTMPGIGNAFAAFDGVVLAGFDAAADALSGETVPELGKLNGGAVIHAIGSDYLVVPGSVTENRSVTGSFSVERRLPDMDFVTECGNRLWGCRYGMSRDGVFVNEIYASKLGDFKNWNCFEGLSTDSYAVSLGSDGPFTGCANHLGYPIFFKENCLHKVYGSYPAEFTLQVTPCRGVQAGSHRSVALVGDTLYYKSALSVCAYDGSLPVEVSRALGSLPETGCAGALGSKYCLSTDAGLFVLDTARGVWHREEGIRCESFAGWGDKLYALDTQGLIWDMTGGEEAVPFFCQTGDLGQSVPQHKYISGVFLRAEVGEQTTAEFYGSFDGGPWERLGFWEDPGKSRIVVPLCPRRCAGLRLKLQGQGPFCLKSIRLRVEKGSVMPW